MSSLMDYGTRSPGRPCSVCTSMNELRSADPELHSQIEDVFAGNTLGISDSVIHAALQANGLRVGRQMIGHHRRGLCSGKIAAAEQEAAK